jgi:uncharacterized protein YjbJ (UPF0337 family)
MNSTLNLDILQGEWKQAKGQVKERWGLLNDLELNRIQGNFDELVDIIQETYGYAWSRAERDVEEFLRQAEDDD